MIDIKYEAFNKIEHLPSLVAWIEAAGGSVPPLDRIPTTGFVGSDESGPCSMVLYYATNSSVALCEFLTVRPDLRGIERSNALDGVISTCISALKEIGLSLFCVAQTDRVKMRLERHGFKTVQTGLSFLTL